MPRGSTLRTPSGVIAVLVSLAAAALMVWRMRRGLDITDEAFYLALPLRFALGDRPFVDELNIAQTAGLLIYPFVRAYTFAVGSSTGLFLFIRLLYLVFFGLVGWSAFALARTRLSSPAALLVGTACLCFIPYGLPGLSYNTLSMGLFALGLFVVARWLLLGNPTRGLLRAPLFWAGVAHAGSCFAYPSLLLGVVATLAVLFVLALCERLRASCTYALGGVAFCLAVSPLFLAAGSHLRAVFAYSGGSGSVAAFTWPEAASKLTAFLAQHPQLPLAAFLSAVALTVARRFPLLTAVGVMFLPRLALGSQMPGSIASLGFVSCFALLGPVLSLGLRDRRTARVLVFGIALPSGVAGAVAGLSSSNGIVAVGLGLYPGAILTAMLLAMFIDQTLRLGGWPRVRPYLALSPALVVWSLLEFCVTQDCVYRDGRLDDLTALMKVGPYKGIYTSPAKQEFLRLLAADIQAYGRGERALFIYDLPAGYLMAYRRPLTASPWIFPLLSRAEADAAYFRNHAKSGDLVVVDRAYPQLPLNQAIVSLSLLAETRPSYAVYLVR